MHHHAMVVRTGVLLLQKTFLGCSHFLVSKNLFILTRRCSAKLIHMPIVRIVPLLLVPKYDDLFFGSKTSCRLVSLGLDVVRSNWSSWREDNRPTRINKKKKRSTDGTKRRRLQLSHTGNHRNVFGPGKNASQTREMVLEKRKRKNSYHIWHQLATTRPATRLHQQQDCTTKE